MKKRRNYNGSQTIGTNKPMLSVSNQRQKGSNTTSQRSLGSRSNSLIENMTRFEIPYFGGNDILAGEISFVLENVPEPVRKFALERCIFTSIDKTRFGGTCCQLPIRHDVEQPTALWLIELSEDIPHKFSVRYRKHYQHMLRFYVAHELAHAYLNQRGVSFTDKVLTHILERHDEVAVDQLMRQWCLKPVPFFKFYLQKREEERKKAEELETKWAGFKLII